MPQARNIPDTPPEWKQKQPKPDLGRSYAIELITPLFGGGVETRVNDPSFPIRVTSIRGQLQFWWRATVGAQYASRQELRAAQSAIWGNTEQASRVQVRVEDVQAAKPTPCATFDRHGIITTAVATARCHFGTHRSTNRPALCVVPVSGTTGTGEDKLR
jgi:CRISPR type III-B/RAMP module RAMP protein Cmr1